MDEIFHGFVVEIGSILMFWRETYDVADFLELSDWIRDFLFFFQGD